jgi:co-chaperonin GroES (HSP10)
MPKVIVVKNKLAIEAVGERIWVLRDHFKSGYECPTCKGSRYVGACELCLGKGEVKKEECRICHGSGKRECPDCQGKGVKSGGLVIPDESQKPPETGVILSVGPEATGFKEGDHVVYSSYAGTELNFKGAGKIRVLVPKEVLGLIYGLNEEGDTVGYDVADQDLIDVGVSST